MRRTGIWLGTSLSLLLAATIVVGPGCASTKNVMNKATFGLVGGDSEDEAATKEAKQQAEEQKRAEKQANKEQERADKQARKQEKETAKAQGDETERGFMSKATFGLVGGGSEDKAAKKEAKRQAEAEKKAEKQARKQEKELAKAEADRTDETDPSDSSASSERGFMSKATFGLVGGGSEDKAAKKEAKRQSEEQKRAEKQAAKEEEKAQERAREEQKRAEKQARKEEKQMAEAESDQADQADSSTGGERSLMSKATFGLVGGDPEEKAEKKEAKRQAEEQEKAEKEARKQEKQMAKAESDQPDQAGSSESSDKPKRGLMSKLTFGLVGGDGSDDADRSVEQEMPASTPEPPVPMAAAQSDYGVQPESEMSNDARKLAKLPFETALSYDSLSASGKQQAVASRSTYSKHNHGITDLGDVRIAVRNMTFSGGTRGGHVIVSSEDRAKASGSAGIGNETFKFDYERGVTVCTFGTLQFTIELGVITIDGRSVPMGQGHKLVIVDAQGNVEGVYGIE
jgi:hypothetical protein